MMHHVRRFGTLLLALAVIVGAQAVARAQEAGQVSAMTPTPLGPAPAPGGEAGQYPVAQPAQPGGEIVHTVRAGENLFRIAQQYNVTVDALAQYNGITNTRLIYVGQQLRIPGAQPLGTPAPAPDEPVYPTAAPAPAEMLVTPTAGAAPEEAQFPTAAAAENLAQNVGFAFGVQVHLPNQDAAVVLGSVNALGVTWAKQVIDWSLYEAAPGAIDWAALDEIVLALDAAGVNILLTVTNAPDWAREGSEEAGPPADPQTYAAFVGALAQRYAGVVDAYEIWDSPNLRRAWNTPRGISATDYVALLQAAFSAIKLADPVVVVVSGGLAPTGFNDGVNAIDDRVYLRQMYDAGLAEWSDAIGAHPNGWANPPDSTCCRNNRPAVAAWDDHPSFFFKDTLSDYRAIMVEKLDSGTYIWATEFGWGSNDGLNITPAEALGFVEYTTLDEQAQYIVRGFELGRELGYVGPMFLYNLNFCQVVGQTGEQCLFSLLDPAGNPRPAFFAVENMLN